MDNLRSCRTPQGYSERHALSIEAKGEDTGRELTGADDAPLNGAGDDRRGYVGAKRRHDL
jgi:hypothetical protein